MIKKEKASNNVFMGNNPARKVFNIVNYIILSMMVIAAIVPLWHIIMISFSASAAVDAGRVSLWPVDFTWHAYEFILQNAAFYTSFLVSVLRVIAGVSVNMLVTILMAYPLSKSRLRFPKQKYYVWLCVVTMFFRGGIVPTFMIVKSTGLMNSFWSLILPGAVSVFNMLILLNFFRDIPQELEESALMDGAGQMTVLHKIFLPLAKPALATLVLFFFVAHWNAWFDGLMYLNSPEKFPLQTYLQGILTVPDLNTLTNDQLAMWANTSRRATNAAQIVVSTLPIMVIYPFLQKYYTKGLTLGGVKG